jgi:NAD(P)-dependent dehydrogenase (short-subunit alcohol dehydrogenase family)
MSRTYAITGAASGVAKATAELLRSRGEKVIGVDLRDVEVIADLSTAEGRAEMVEKVTELSGGKLDAILAVAGLSAPKAITTAVNYFGMVDTLTGLRPLLAGSDAPRAVGIASTASLLPVDVVLVNALLAHDEATAMERSEWMAEQGPVVSNQIYPSTKQAFARWIRRNAISPDWAGSSIPLNAIAPGVLRTPMTEELLATEQGRAIAMMSTPMPLNGPATAQDAAYLLAWLTSAENTHLCGQIVFIDGGTDASYRGDSTW